MPRRQIIVPLIGWRGEQQVEAGGRVTGGGVAAFLLSSLLLLRRLARLVEWLLAFRSFSLLLAVHVKWLLSSPVVGVLFVVGLWGHRSRSLAYGSIVALGYLARWSRRGRGCFGNNNSRTFFISSQQLLQ